MNMKNFYFQDTSQLENDLKNNGLGIKQEIYTLDSNHVS